MAKILKTSATTDGYDFEGEAARLALADVVIGQRRLNRGTAQIKITGPIESEETALVRRRWQAELFPTTLPADAPVIELGWPTHGPFVSAPHGVYFDGYLAVAQKLIDENHPRFRSMLDALDAAGALLRREIVTDDFLATDDGETVKTPADLAHLWSQSVHARWSWQGGYRAFFSSSGAEAIEAALKLAFQAAYKRFVATHGMEVFRQVQSELGIAEVPYFERDPSLSDHPVFDDYPFQLVGCEGAFHGRTLGALSVTWSKRAHRLSYPRAWNVQHIPYNAPGEALRERMDMRPIGEILAIPGELRRVLHEQRRIPKDLFAGFLAEPFQGEGGYVPGDPAFFAAARALCDETDALLIVDEVQSVGRTGRLLMTEHLGVRPDVVCTAKSMVIGVTIARADLAASCHGGWHSNTWGAGRTLDTNFAYTTLDALLNHRQPAFGGLSYVENCEAKGRYLAAGLERLAEKHPDVLVGQRGVGLMRALLVRRRDDVVATGWEHGLKLLGCGLDGEVAPIRLLMLADTLTREIDQLLAALDKTFKALT